MRPRATAVTAIEFDQEAEGAGDLDGAARKAAFFRRGKGLAAPGTSTEGAEQEQGGQQLPPPLAEDLTQ
jgi:hypothetical protein